MGFDSEIAALFKEMPDETKDEGKFHRGQINLACKQFFKLGYPALLGLEEHLPADFFTIPGFKRLSYEKKMYKLFKGIIAICKVSLNN